MQVVGIDFGTSNVRIATWDSEGDLPPQPKFIGAQATPAMPAVVALERQDNGEIAVLTGEKADVLEDEDNHRIVIRNIKRFALSSDSYVQWHLDVRNAHEAEAKWPPAWWNSEKRCVQAWGQEYPVWNLIGNILDEAFWRADIQGEYEWRAGCPVHSNYDYRNSLSRILEQVTGQAGAPQSIVEEPLLFLTAARRLGDLERGAFLVYDFGGGSFDSALTELGDQEEILIYGADGHPLLGGSDIDDAIAEKIGYTGQRNLLRQAKESLNTTNPSVVLQDGTTLSMEDVDAVLKEGSFGGKSASVLRDAYIGAKYLWKRGNGPDDPPIGEILHRDGNLGTVRFTWQLNWVNLAEDVDGILLFGGPSRHQFLQNNLRKLFGEGKIIFVEELLQGLEEAAITGASIGACYFGDNVRTEAGSLSTPMYVNRIPVRVTLEDLYSGDKVQYDPFEHLVSHPKRPFDDYVSQKYLSRYSHEPHGENRYELTIATVDDVLLTVKGRDGIERDRHPVDPYISTRSLRAELRLVIDRYGRVGVEQWEPNSARSRYLILEDTPWQNDLQSGRLTERFEEEREYIKDHSRFVPSNWREGLKAPGGRAL
jgi:hypothetical protein